MVRVERIELSPHPWQGRVLPLNDTRMAINIHYQTPNSKLCAPAKNRTWNDGFEDRHDIRFTTGAMSQSYSTSHKNQKM